MPNTAMTTKLVGMRVVDAARGKRIGKVRHFVYHPSERRCIGFTVKRPDAALMFHRKDLFVALGGFHEEDGQLVVHDDPAATDRGAIKALGVNWAKCTIWAGMPVMTKSGVMLGYVDAVSFDLDTGEVHWLTTENGAANDVILGKRKVPAKYIRGFRQGRGDALVSMSETGDREAEEVARGAILVADEAADLPIDGGAAAAAGKATAVVTNKAKEGAAKAKAAASERVEKAKPAARKAAKATGEAVEAGSFAVGRQLGRATGMFSAFKEEFDKASKGEGD